MATANARVRADLIYKALAKKHKRDVFIGEVKTGRTWDAPRGHLGIIDALAIKRSWTNPCITGYEVKVSRGDFMRDEKWPKYVAMCHRFYFVCPKGIVEPEDLPAGIGLLWYNPEKGTLYTRVAANYRVMEELPTDMLYYIILSKTDSDRHPFFSDTREYLEAWLEDKEERYAFGIRVSDKLAKAKKELERAKTELGRQKEDVAWLNEMLSFLRERDITFRRWDWERVLGDALDRGVSTAVKSAIDKVISGAKDLERFLAKEKGE